MKATMEPNHRSIIRMADFNDLEVIMEIEKKCFPGPISYSRAQMRYLIFHANSVTFVEGFGDVVRGFVVIAYREGISTGYVETLDVDPQYSKHGIGLKLLMHAEDDMRRKGKKLSQLEVSEGNKAALRLYKKAGYLPKERLKGYYRYEHVGTRDALRMVKVL